MPCIDIDNINIDPSEIAWIEGFHLIHNEVEETYDFVVVFGTTICKSKSTVWPGERLGKRILKFTDVQNLSFQKWQSGNIQIMGFDITDVQQNGWERKNYLIEDYENGLLEFYCQKIYVLSEQNVS